MKRLILFLAAVAFLGCAAAQKPVKANLEQDTATIYVVVEQDPEFPGGMESLYQYLAGNVKYPAEAKANKIEGRVYVTFVVEKDGSVTNARIIRSPHESLSAEALRVVQAMPKWRPGRTGGKPVRVQFNLPINFKL